MEATPEVAKSLKSIEKQNVLEQLFDWYKQKALRGKCVVCSKQVDVEQYDS